jgi:hypothetical protein
MGVYSGCVDRGRRGGAAYHDFCHKAHRKPYLYLHDRAAVQPAGGRSLMTGFRDVFPAPSVFFKSFALFSVVVIILYCF